MELNLPAKIAAFCRELGDDSNSSLRAMAACEDDAHAAFMRAEESVKGGRIDPELEADLDALDAMVAHREGQGFYPAATRGYQPLPGSGGDTGAQWWACPRHRCAGRGRVRPGQQSPVCDATGERLLPTPFSR